MDILAWSQNLTTERAGQVGATGNQGRTIVSRGYCHYSSGVKRSHEELTSVRELGSMKSTAYLINTSRGPIVHEKALIEALQKRTIAGAGLDVFDLEPLSLDHPLRHLENMVITPHIGYVTQETYEIFFRHIVEDIRAFLDGKPVRIMTASR